ncbi:MAG: TorF family putative porin [Azovibrio sp.]|nr:TorF family putative porin [Azovibrio sp.]
MQEKRIAVVLAAASVFASVAVADEAAGPHSFTGNFAITTDYLFRGISQTQNKPALQGGFDYAHSSGLYVGVWGSNVKWVDTGGYKDNNSLELDLYGGYKGELGPLSYDLGMIRYYYPGDYVANATSPDTTEAYVGLGWQFLSFKYSHVVSENFVGWKGSNDQKTRGSQYYDLSLAYPLENGWGIGAHVGYQKVKHNSDASYTDWNVYVSKDLGFGTVKLMYADSNADGCGSASRAYCWDGKDVGDARAVLSFSKTF